MLLAATAGLRRGEVLGLRWSDVDLERKRLSVRQTIGSVRHVATMGTPKTDVERVVSLDPRVVAALKAHRKRQMQRWMQAGVRPTLDLVVTDDGQVLHLDQLLKRFQRSAARVGVPVIAFHGLRHTCAVLALQGGVHPKVVQERLGHASIAMTMDIYSHVLPTMQEQAAETIGDMIWGQRG